MRLKDKYNKQILPELKKKYSITNDFLAPRLDKVVINVGFGQHGKEKEYAVGVAKTLTSISGQKPVMTKAKKSISSFKIREGMVVGSKVTLRGQRMYDFIEKLVNITFPRVRDFRGLEEKNVDSRGQMTIGFKENSAFPELRLEDLENVHGLEVTVVCRGRNRVEILDFLYALGFPFKKN
jgi:large subunit ribosomal protein L5